MPRSQAVFSLIAIVPMLLLGGVWPSLYTLVALASLPAGLLAVAAFIRPAVLTRRSLRLCVQTSAIVCALGLIIQPAYMAW
jgi:hypothetical protein